MSLEFTHAGYNAPDPSVGEQCGYFDDFEVDREKSSPESLAEFDALTNDEQERIIDDAHSEAIDEKESDDGFAD